MRSFFRVVGLSFLLASIFISACSRPTATITLAGSTSFQPFAEKLAEQYMMNKGARINVQGGGSAVGIQSALTGSADIGMADMLTLPDEAKVLTSTTVARDGIAIIINPKNTLSNLSARSARDIFSGVITNWKDVGGMDGPIRIFSREDGSGTRRSFDKMVLGGAKIAAGSLFQNSNGTIREAVASDPNVIGYISIGLVNDRVKAVSYNGISPTNVNVKSGKYPLSRPVYFLTKEDVKPNAKEFIDFVLSKTSQDMLEKEGLVSIK